MRFRFVFLLLVGVFVLQAPVVAFADYLSDARQSLQKGDIKNALLQLRNAVKSDPQNAEARFLLAKVHMERGDVIAAEKEAQAAAERGFDPRLVIPLLTQTYLAQGKFKQLLEDFQVQKKDPTVDSEILVARGIAYGGLKNLDEAKKSFDDAEALTPNAVQPVLAGARLALVRSDLATAQTKVDRALVLNPNSVEALLAKATLLRIAHDPDGAIAVLDRVITQQPTSIRARLDRANVNLGIGKDDKVKEDVDYVLSAKPADVEATYLRAVLLARAKSYAEADVLLEKLTAYISRLPRGYFIQALVKQNLGLLEQAEDAIRKYVARSPEDIDGYKLMARIGLQKGRPGGVIDSLKLLITSGRGDADVYDMLGRAYVMDGKFQPASEAFQKAQTMVPDDVGVNVRLAAARMAAGDTNGAILDLERALRLGPKDAAVGEALFFAVLTTGDLPRAQDALDRIKAAQGETASVSNLEGVLLMTRHDLDGARAKFQAAIAMTPDFMPAKINLVRLAVMQERMGEAQQVLAGILDKSPTSDPALMMYVATLIADGNVAQAIKMLERAHAAVPASAHITTALADMYSRSGDPRKALEVIGPEKNIQTMEVELIGARARAQLALGQTKDARDTYTQLLDRDPANVTARRALAALLVTTGDVEIARNVIQKGLILSPRDPQLLQDFVAIDLRVVGVDAALATADRLQRQDLNFAPAKALRGDVFTAAKRWDDAIAAYGSAIKETQNPPAILVERLANAQERAGRPDDAAATLDRWMKDHPDDTSAAQFLAGLDINAKRYAQAEQRLTELLLQKPQDALALNNLAWLYQQRGDPRAQVTAQRAYILNPNAQSADTLGWILTKSGKADAAMVLLRQAVIDASYDPRLSYHYAVALAQIGKKDEALKVLAPILLDGVEFDQKAEAQKLQVELTQKS